MLRRPSGLRDGVTLSMGAGEEWFSTVFHHLRNSAHPIPVMPAILPFLLAYAALPLVERSGNQARFP